MNSIKAEQNRANRWSNRIGPRVPLTAFTHWLNGWLDGCWNWAGWLTLISIFHTHFTSLSVLVSLFVGRLSLVHICLLNNTRPTNSWVNVNLAGLFATRPMIMTTTNNTTIVTLIHLNFSYMRTSSWQLFSFPAWMFVSLYAF